ncbi:MAG: hypothetical protein ABL967_03130 [Bryobacteraceae bacterium]
MVETADKVTRIGLRNAANLGDNGDLCIEWTGAGGDYFLAVVVENDRVISEHWGTQAEILHWMNERWPLLPRRFVPMVFSSNTPEVERHSGPRLTTAKKKRARH